MKLVYDVESKPKFHQLIVFAFQQVLAIMAATIAVPLIVGNGMYVKSPSSGTSFLVYDGLRRRHSTSPSQRKL
jgi:Xanthine/uracil permeases